MEMEMARRPKKTGEAERFDAALDRILSVSHDELKRREEAWKAGRTGKKRGPKAKTGRI
jgi:hypothetical protein